MPTAMAKKIGPRFFMRLQYSPGNVTNWHAFPIVNMIDGLLIFVGGLLGSSHCVGMCGGFVLTLGAGQKGWHKNLARQMIYATGRIGMYILAGAVVAYCGWRLGREMSTVIYVQATLSFLAGFLLTYEGLVASGVLPRWQWAGINGCPGAAEFAALLRSTSSMQVFVAGFINGLLPCGLVYAYLALAASTGHIGLGMLVMLLFGLGTMPALVLTGSCGSFLSGQSQRRIFLLAAWCMVVTGIITIGRGFLFLNALSNGASEQHYQIFCHSVPGM